jgi:hypothetical protein
MDFQTIYHVIVTNLVNIFNIKNCEFHEDETRKPSNDYKGKYFSKKYFVIIQLNTKGF